VPVTMVDIPWFAGILASEYHSSETPWVVTGFRQQAGLSCYPQRLYKEKTRDGNATHW
jgi:hypothetical protein